MLNLERNILLIGIATALAAVMISGQERDSGSRVYTAQQATADEAPSRQIVRAVI